MDLYFHGAQNKTKLHFTSGSINLIFFLLHAHCVTVTLYSATIMAFCTFLKCPCILQQQAFTIFLSFFCTPPPCNFIELALVLPFLSNIHVLPSHINLVCCLHSSFLLNPLTYVVFLFESKVTAIMSSFCIFKA